MNYRDLKQTSDLGKKGGRDQASSQHKGSVELKKRGRISGAIK